MDLIRRDAYISTAIPVAINRQMVDDPDATSIVNFHRNPRSHHRQMVDGADATSIEDLHRVAAVATWRRCESDEKIET